MEALTKPGRNLEVQDKGKFFVDPCINDKQS